MKEFYDAMAMKRALTRITYEIVESNKGTQDLVLIGIKTRGVYLARRIADQLQKLENVAVPVGELDVTNYRDDRRPDTAKENLRLGVDINDKRVVLVDDVFFTGRTIRAAMDAIMDQGRPKRVRLRFWLIVVIVSCRFGLILSAKHSNVHAGTSKGQRQRD